MTKKILTIIIATLKVRKRIALKKKHFQNQVLLKITKQQKPPVIETDIYFFLLHFII